jgi:hypothetical protein
MAYKTVYLLNEIGWEYNDNYHDRHGEQPLEAYASREKAQAECDKRNEKARLNNDYILDDEQQPVTEFFTVTNITLED